MFTRQKMADVSVLSSYGSCETRNKRCSSCILATKRVTQTNYYNNLKKFYLPLFSRYLKKSIHKSIELFNVGFLSFQSKYKFTKLLKKIFESFKIFGCTFELVSHGK